MKENPITISMPLQEDVLRLRLENEQLKQELSELKAENNRIIKKPCSTCIHGHKPLSYYFCASCFHYSFSLYREEKRGDK